MNISTVTNESGSYELTHEEMEAVKDFGELSELFLSNFVSEVFKHREEILNNGEINYQKLCEAEASALRMNAAAADVMSRHLGVTRTSWGVSYFTKWRDSFQAQAQKLLDPLVDARLRLDNMKIELDGKFDQYFPTASGRVQLSKLIGRFGNAWDITKILIALANNDQRGVLEASGGFLGGMIGATVGEIVGVAVAAPAWPAVLLVGSFSVVFAAIGEALGKGPIYDAIYGHPTEDLEKFLIGFGTSDADVLVPAGDDTHRYFLIGGDGNDIVYGRARGDLLEGGLGNDNLEGGDGDDHLSGSEGDDILLGGAGNDRLEGGDGFDTYNFVTADFAAGATEDTIVDSDGLGKITFNGLDISGTGIGFDNIHVATAGLVWETSNGAFRLFVAGEGAATSLVIVNRDTGARIVVKDWSNGDLGITLPGYDPVQPNTSSPLTTGDDLFGNSQGDAGVNNLNGLAGSDAMDGGAGDDILDGGAGNDLIYGGAGNDRLNGSDGNDFIFDRSEAPGLADWSDVVGPDGKSPRQRAEEAMAALGDLVVARGKGWYVYAGTGDTFMIVTSLGTTNLNPNVAPSGDDTIDAGAGNDEVWAGEGDDTVFGGDGDDRLWGAHDDDIVNGGDGSDTIYGDGGTADDPSVSDQAQATGDDVLGGGAGNDFIVGGGGNDLIDGGDGNDMLMGGGAFGAADPEDVDRDYIDGGLGDDQITGDAGDDTLLGGAGMDSIWGDAGNDVLSGGDGNDQLDGDAVDIDESLHGDDEIVGGAGDDTLWGAGGNDVLRGGDGVDLLLGGAGDDVLDGGLGDDTLFGESNENLLTGDDRLSGGAGDDKLGGGAGNDLLDGGEDNDILHGNDGDDRLMGGAGNDQLAGDAGSDVLDGGAGADHLLGGDGDDQLAGGADDDELGGEAGNDVLSGGSGDDILHGDDGNDQLAGDSGNDQLAGDAGNDVLDGSDGDDQIAAGVGDDIVQAGSGNDQAWGEAGEDNLTGGDGDDELAGGDGNDIVDAGNGNDQLWGEAGADRLVGGAGDDALQGGDGNDDLTGGAGNDRLVGGAGDDIYRFERGFGNDWIYQSSSATAGHDVISFGAGITTADVYYGRSGDDLVIYFRNSTDKVTVQDFLNPTYMIDIRFADSTLLTRQQIAQALHVPNAVLYSDGNDNITGTAGDDFLFGGGGDDVMRGLTGYDYLNGGEGNDTLSSGPLSDLLEGGQGNDTYLFGSFSGGDEVLGLGDANSGSDTMRFTGALTYDKINTIQVTGDDVTILFAADGMYSSVTLRGFLASSNGTHVVEFEDGTQLVADDFRMSTARWQGTSGNDTYGGTAGNDIIYGGAGNDILAGGDGVDRLYGDAGSDTLSGDAGRDVLQGGLGADTLYGGAGDDQLYGIDTDGGIDIMNGGLGDDRYYVGAVANGLNSPDQVIESINEGLDTVYAASYSYTLPDNVENLVAKSIDTKYYNTNSLFPGWKERIPRSLIGNALDNTITSVSSDHLYLLDGGAGADTLIGSSSDDIYVVDQAGDRVIENGISSIDTVRASYSYSLGDNVNIEIVELTGSVGISATGNAGNNILDGSTSSGTNTLMGGFGDDTYVIGAGDQVVEAAGGGIDTLVIGGRDAAVIWTNAAFDLADYANIENMTLGSPVYATGFAGNLQGDANANVLTGNGLSNVIHGGDGNDTLIGGERTLMTFYQSKRDQLFGDGGNDVLRASRGGASLDGGTGDDELYGADNVADDFIYAAGGGRDTVYSSGGSGTDSVLFAEDVNPADVSFSRDGTTLVVQVGADSSNQLLVEEYWTETADGLAVSGAIDQFVFADGTVLSGDLDQLSGTLSAAAMGDRSTGATGFVSDVRHHAPILMSQPTTQLHHGIGFDGDALAWQVNDDSVQTQGDVESARGVQQLIEAMSRFHQTSGVIEFHTDEAWTTGVASLSHLPHRFDAGHWKGHFSEA